MTEDAIMSPVHPGEVLQDEYLKPLGRTQHRLVVAIDVPPRRINEIVHGKRGITAEPSSASTTAKPPVLVESVISHARDRERSALGLLA